MVFALCLVLLALSFISALFLKMPKVVLSKADLEKMKGLKISNFFEPKVFPIAIISAFVGLGYSSILSFLTSYAKEMNLVDISSFFFIVYAVTVLVSRPFTGRWFDTKGENFVMYPSFLLFAAGLVLLNQADSGLLILLAGIFVGLGYGTFSASGQAIAVKVSPKNRIGLATSTFFIFLDAGVGVSAVFARAFGSVRWLSRLVRHHGCCPCPLRISLLFCPWEKSCIYARRGGRSRIICLNTNPGIAPGFVFFLAVCPVQKQRPGNQKRSKRQALLTAQRKVLFFIR